MLGHIVSGSFTAPALTYQLYDAVRSAAVHGEDPPSVDRGVVGAFDLSVRRTLNEYLDYGRSRGFASRKQLLTALEGDPETRTVIKWLREQDPDTWREYQQAHQ